MPGPRAWAALAAAVTWLSLTPHARAADPAAAVAAQALHECEDGRRAVGRAERAEYFERGKALAQHAVAVNDESADAHFALFCNLGELMRLDGESLSSAFGLRRLMAEIDRTLELNPDHLDAMSAKGQLLVRLPRLFGGDANKGEEMLREVVSRDPTAFSSRITLARTCGARGDRDEAIALASRALQIARAQGRADKIAEAQATLSELHTSN